MRGDYPYLKSSLRIGSGLPARGTPYTFIFFLIAGSLVFSYFTPGLSDQRQLTCSLPASSPANPHADALTPPRDDFATPEDPASLASSQEIADVTGSGDSLLSVLCANLIEDATARRIANDMASVIGASFGKKFNAYTQLKPGTRYSISVDPAGNFQKVTVEMDPAHVFHAVPRSNNTIHSWKEEVVLDFRVEALTFKVQGTLTESLLNAGEGTELALKLTNVFRWDIDFQSESMRGDVCKVLFERRYADDRPSGYGHVLAAVYEGKKGGRRTAVLFNGQYYDKNAIELNKNFLRSPLSVIRVTSRYGKRFHPVLRMWRSHNGVDYGAPAGTNVWSVSRGVVTFAGWNNGYGNYVCIQHDNGIESRYGHLSRVFVKKGERVKQRQRVGLVGQTGIATGPHLDFQLLRGGEHVDPLDRKNKMVQDLRRVPPPLGVRFAQVAAHRFSSLTSAVPSQSVPKVEGLASSR